MLIFIKGTLVRLDLVSLKDAVIINIIFVNLNSMLMHDFISRNGQKRFLKNPKMNWEYWNLKLIRIQSRPSETDQKCQIYELDYRF